MLLFTRVCHPISRRWNVPILASLGSCFISSAFSAEAVDLLRRVGVSAWKISSGESLSFELLRLLGQDGAPILISTGMSTHAEIDATVRQCREWGIEPVLLQCTSMYPTPPERLGLNVLDELRSRHGCPVGLSDHSEGWTVERLAP